MTSFETVRVAAIQATPVVLDVEACIEKAERLLHAVADEGARLAVLPECFVLALPVRLLGGGDEPVGRSVRRALGAAVDQQRRRARADDRPPGRRLPRARPVLRRSASTSASRQRPGSLWNTHGLPRARRAARQAPQAHADRARAPVPRDRRRRRPRGGRHADRPHRRPDLLGELHAAGALRGLPRRPADLRRADRRRLRALAELDAPHRVRVGRVRRVGAAVHPGRGVPRRLPGRPPRGQGGLRERRRGDHRARRRHGRRRTALRRGGHTCSTTATSPPRSRPSAPST